MTLSALLDRFDLLLDTPDAVPQLRQFILQLAVQGRLTEQNPDDEPAEALLKEMEAEKKRLKKAGDYKYQKKMPSITADNLTLPTSLPTGWAWVRFGALGTVTGGGTPKKSNPDYWGGTIPWVSPKDMGDTVIRQTQDHITEKGLDDSSAKRIPESSVLIVGRSGILQRTLPVAINAVECTVNQDLKVLTPFKREMARYIQIMLKGFQPHILTHLVKTGTTVESLKYTAFQLQPYPLPPRAEQKRIVETVDRLMDECDALEATQTQMRETQSAATVSAAHALRTAPDADALRTAWDRVATHFDALTATPDAVDELRQTILQLAVQGRLTEQDPDDEPAEVLLERIGGQKEAVRLQSESYLPDLPDNWEWIPLKMLLSNLRNGYSKAPKADSGIPVLRISAVRPMDVDCSDVRYLEERPENFDKYLARPGDLLFIRYNGNASLVGACGVVPHYVDAIGHPDKLIRGEVESKEVSLPEYLEIALNGGTSRDYLDSKAKTTAGNYGISQTDLRPTPVPLPPLAEQKRIVETVDRLLAVCDRLAERLQDAEATGAAWCASALAGAVEAAGEEVIAAGVAAG